MAINTSTDMKKVEESLEKFRELRRNLGPNAKPDQQQFLDEMISNGEKALRALNHDSRIEEPASPLSLSFRRVKNTLLLFAVVMLVMFVFYAVTGVGQRGI